MADEESAGGTAWILRSRLGSRLFVSAAAGCTLLLFDFSSILLPTRSGADVLTLLRNAGAPLPPRAVWVITGFHFCHERDGKRDAERYIWRAVRSGDARPLSELPPGNLLTQWHRSQRQSRAKLIAESAPGSLASWVMPARPSIFCDWIFCRPFVFSTSGNLRFWLESSMSGYILSFGDTFFIGLGKFLDFN